MKSGVFARILSPLSAFVFCLILTSAASFLAFQTAKLENAARFDRAVGSFVSTLRNRMTVYTNTVLATRSMFMLKPDVTEKEFQQFVNQMGIKENFPGIQTIGYVERLSIPEAKTLLKKMGLTVEHARIPMDSSAASIIRYIVSFQGNSSGAKGLDMGTTDDRRYAMDQARDSGQLVASGSLVPLVTPTTGGASSFLVFVPIYKTTKDLNSVKERRNELKGFIYGGFRSENLFGRLTKDLHFRSGHFFVEVFDGPVPSDENLIYRESGNEEALSHLETVIPFSYADHTWSIRFVAPKAYLVSYLRWAPFVIFVFGFLVSLTIAWVLRKTQAARQEADAANQAKSIFLANISHEIRTPLGVILGFAEMALGQNSPAERDSSLKTIIRNGKELTRIIGDVLDVSKIEANLLKIEKAPFHPQKMMNEIAEIWRPLVEGKGIRFDLEISPSVPEEILADETRIKQIIINLISNSTKFTTKGFIKVSIQVDSGYLKITVSDSGIGISPENQKKLFKPFSQGDSSITRKFGGSGLGLALSKQIATAMGGALSLEKSGEGRGSQFNLQVPIEACTEAVRQAKASQDTPLPSLKGKRILLVEDSADNRALVSMMLKRVGANIETAQDGNEGVAKALQGNFDLVLMDIQMPQKDGYSAFQELKIKGYRRPVIALTAHALTEERDKALAMGFADYLTKPVDYKALIQVSAKFS